MNDQVVLVTENDEAIGLMPKLEAHEKGVLHRAFSVFIFNSNSEMLLQRRAFGKYHSEGLWSNTCCSHPLPGEAVHDGAVRRLREEMGIHADLEFLYTFQYRADLENGLTENELDHVFYGVSDAVPAIDPAEASEYKYLTMDEIQADIAQNPHSYTEWFKICMPVIARRMKV
ncbi:isopentenyl-diphosphate Delta-isomerase [Dyadobacter fermentans]|uniref:Isopentenyl-diphosphate delta-isomerase n=1 Tax=Dyadobacter fermentans (strain ATCC 700827 / DSM 18053 / CIP 107007 / KCTC 52180 / NS114) TaxID=471854 RepID=C6VXB2_DYAFD|nr:isopentenyl-diphosphate Delta-isomerase [Dyadobacter fermentans]ACT93255.1 isopentenyl-diphosphate delta-isomerase, type 1 [Dyadobacter fermentans DSM 18053]